MAEPAVTVVTCRTCSRSADLTFLEGRFWCGWCEDWRDVDAERVDPARQAAALFREVIALLERHPGGHEKYDQVLSAARQYLANQEAVAEAAGG